jgi:hypothetical protein
MNCRLSYIVCSLLLFTACSKGGDDGVGNICFTNKTNVDFSGFSGLDVAQVSSNNFTRNKQQCVDVPAVQGAWAATLKNQDWTFAKWEGNYDLAEGQNLSIDVTDAFKTFDFRNRMTGEYNMKCVTSNINTNTFDTVQISVDQTVPTFVNKASNALQIDLSAGVHFNGPGTFSGNPFYFSISGGTSGVFPPTDSTLSFYTQKTIGANAVEMCRCDGKKKQ